MKKWWIWVIIIAIILLVIISIIIFINKNYQNLYFKENLNNTEVLNKANNNINEGTKPISENKIPDNNEQLNNEIVNTNRNQSGYLIENDIKGAGYYNYEYTLSEESSPDISFSETFKEGYKAVYKYNVQNKIVETNVWIFNNKDKLNDDLENYIFSLLSPTDNKYTINLQEGNKVISLVSKYGSKDGSIFIWVSNKKIIKIIETTNSYFLMREYLKKYPSTFKVSQTCKDSGNGNNYDVGGYVKYLPVGDNSQYGVFEDVCVIQPNQDSLILKGYCENGEFKTKQYDCPETCVGNVRYAYCGGLTVVPNINIIFPSNGGEYTNSGGGFSIKADTNLRGICEIKLNKDNIPVLDWTKIDTNYTKTHQYIIQDYMQNYTNYELDTRCFNSAGYGNTQSISFKYLYSVG